MSSGMLPHSHDIWTLLSDNYVGPGDLNIENTNIKTASGVSLDEQQRTLVGSVLDVSVGSEHQMSSGSLTERSSLQVDHRSRSFNYGMMRVPLKTLLPKP